MTIPEYLILDDEPANNDAGRKSKYDREPVATVFFSDNKSRAFWETLSPEETAFIAGCFDTVRSRKGELADRWLQEAVYGALEHGFSRDLYAKNDPELSPDLFLKNLIPALRRNLIEFEPANTHYALWLATTWAFREALFDEEAADAAS